MNIRYNTLYINKIIGGGNFKSSSPIIFALFSARLHSISLCIGMFLCIGIFCVLASGCTERKAQPGDVYVIKTSFATAYHRTDSCEGLKNTYRKPTPVSLEEAKEMGRHACGYCFGHE